MAFKHFGKVNFVPNTKVEKFADELRYGKLMGTRCPKCSAVYFPPRAECVKCLNTSMEWVPFSGKGKLVTYTTIHAAPVGFEDIAPYTIGLADMEEGGRVAAWIENISEIKIGMEVNVVPKIMEETEEMILYYVLTAP